MTTKDFNEFDKKTQQSLSGIDSRPSTEFYERMKKAPWNRKPNRRPGILKPALAFGLTILLLFLVVTLRSPLSALARSIATYFIASEEPQITIRLDEMEGFQNPIHVNSVASLQSIVDFQLTNPGYIPQGYDPSDLYYHPALNTAHWIFRSDRGETIEIIQSPNVKNYRRIYSLEHVEQVSIGDKIGEYSIGTWKEDDTVQTTAQATSTIQAQWEPTLEYQVLRWMDGGMIFEVRYYYLNGTDIPSMKQELLQIANSIGQVNE